jgi:hypothetical protein
MGTDLACHQRSPQPGQGPTRRSACLSLIRAAPGRRRSVIGPPVRELFSRVVRWQVSLRWYLTALLLIPAPRRLA